jgi:hypothetical protein
MVDHCAADCDSGRTLIEIATRIKSVGMRAAALRGASPADDTCRREAALLAAIAV